MTIYLDNASTSYPKPKEVLQFIKKYILDYGTSPHRGSYPMAEKAEKLVENTRKTLSSFIGVKNFNNLNFTLNATHGLNVILKGYLKKKDHVLICSYNHNAVLRPLERLKEKGIITYDIFQVDHNGEVDAEAFKKKIKNNTALVVCNAASNVTGVISSSIELCFICKNYKIPFLLDCSQSLGYVPLNVDEMGIDFLVGTGHKTLLGPSGVGFFYVKNPDIVETFIEGGSGGVHSISPFPSSITPYKFEAGTLNTTAISGLMGALTYISKKGVKEICKETMDVFKYALKELEEIDEVILYGTKDISKKIPILSFNIKNSFSAEVSYFYSKENICVRSGLQCAPLMHRSLKTLPTGTIRISPSHFNKKEDIDKFIAVTKKIIKNKKIYETCA